MFYRSNLSISNKTIFLKFRFFIEILSNVTRTQIIFVLDDSIGDYLGFDLIVINQKNNLSPNLVDILSFNNVFL